VAYRLLCSSRGEVSEAADIWWRQRCTELLCS